MRSGRVLAALLMAAVFVGGVRWGTFAVGGSDSSCYVIQAERWAALDLQPIVPLSLEAPWPDARTTFAVSGHVASVTVPGSMVPICASGLSIIMAGFIRLAGSAAAFFVVPFFGAVLIGAVYAIGERVSARVGVSAAALTAASPVFLFQLFQPMSDVPAAALWCVATALVLTSGPRRILAAGVATSLAILVRPNLLPLGVVLGLCVLCAPGLSWRNRLRDAGLYALASMPGCLAVAVIQDYFYGGALASGYGTASTIFASSRVGANAWRYLTWLQETETPIWLLAVVAPLVLPNRLVLVCAALVLTNLACYLPYVVFDEWTYLRFLLPALPLLLVLVAVTFDRGLGWGLRGVGGLVQVGVLRVGLTLVTLGVMASMLATARDRNVFALQSLESRFGRAGTFVSRQLPANAAVLASWESGSVTYYGKRQVVVWDALAPDWLDRSIDFLRARGLQPYVLVERWEEPIFRKRFEGSDVARLDWPPSAEVGGLVRIYRPEDRTRYFAGERVDTEYAR